jgi:H+-translocating NAD(P) transhydrogenase subunit alpha
MSQMTRDRFAGRSRGSRIALGRGLLAGLLPLALVVTSVVVAQEPVVDTTAASHAPGVAVDIWPLIYVFVLSSFIGLGVILRVSRLLHTPLMSITNAISAIAVVGAILVTGGDYPIHIRIMGAIALFASMTNIVSGFLITNRMLKMFKTDEKPASGGRP